MLAQMLLMARRCIPWLLLAWWPMLAFATAENHVRLGQEALANQLWEVAGHHFQASLEDESLDVASRPSVSIRLAESLLRAGSNESALEMLRRSEVADHPETTFWQAQALTRQHRYQEALTLLLERQAGPDLPYRMESILSAANLHLLLGRPQEALDLLSSLPTVVSDPMSLRLVLRQIEILLDQNRIADARAQFPNLQQLPPYLAMQGRLLEAQLLLAEDLPQEAALRFQSILSTHPENNTRMRHLAALGYCDSLLDQGKSSEASTFLCDWIQKQPDSPVLGLMLERLIPLLPPPSTANHPAWDLLADWSPDPAVPTTGVIASWDTGAEGALPVVTTARPHQNLIAHALYAQALGWISSPLPQAPAHVRHITRRLLAELPAHPCTGRILLALARKSLAMGEVECAFDQLDALLHSAAAAEIRGESGFVKAIAHWQQGKATLASDAFLHAAEHLDSHHAEAARFNALLIQSIQHREDDTSLVPIALEIDPVHTADLTLERALAAPTPEERLPQLDHFLSQYASHPRVAEARLAAVDAALSLVPPDLPLARSQLDAIDAMPIEARYSPGRVALATLRVHDLQRDSEAVIRLASAFLKDRPETPETAAITFLLGRNLYQTEKYNDARLALERLASTDGNTPQAQACWLLSARAATMVATQQSKQEAAMLFDKAIAIAGPLSAIARLEKARLLVDMSKPMEAETLLANWFSTLAAEDPLYLPAGFLLAESIRSQNTPKALENAMIIYDKLVTRVELEPAARHRLQYVRGLTFEQMGTPDSPSTKRIREAFVAYYSVLESDTPPEEWYYFELCGFKALGMLIDSGRWPAAIACSRRIASFQGPRAKEAADIASQLQLKHQVWED
jgi:tetratricopeptide (TPR) repeat protein